MHPGRKNKIFNQLFELFRFLLVIYLSIFLVIAVREEKGKGSFSLLFPPFKAESTFFLTSFFIPSVSFQDGT
jgi:hypothetical protein